jgi:glutaminyl-tRNA synthetase
LTSKTGGATAGRKIKGTIHWVSAKDCIDAEVRLYDRLFTKADPEEVSEVGTAGSAVRSSFTANLNPHSLETVTGKLEPSLKDAKPELRYQFERLGYFCLDAGSQSIFNRTITLKDTWAKEVKKG